jgi:hypothetical protein
MRLVAFLCVLFFSFGAAAQTGDTVRVGQQVKNAYGIMVAMEQRDIACYLTLRDDHGGTFKEMAEFDVCDRRSMLLNKRVALRYAMQTVASPDCQGNPDCRKSISAIIVSDARPAANVPAPPVSARGFLDGIYRPYLAKAYPGQTLDQPDRFFSPPLARAIERDRREAAKRKEVPTLDGDPFVDAQDWAISDLAVTATENGPRATGVVTFKNQGAPSRVTVDLVMTPAGWRIDDIRTSQTSLRKLFKLP